MGCAPIKNGNVILVEPNCININNDVVNGIPQYQDMYIFAELTAQSKGRTIIINGNANSTTSKTINFIGNNQNNENPDNPNYLNFTTNYYDGSNAGSTHYEGFGMNDIKIVINSSFIPQVNIQFIDVRGLAFFNQVDSPYRILFDFPPPIFSLTVKGYYGKPLTYKLHLVKYTSEFSSANGNFIIDAQFVAVTFAPLTDILFRYVVNTPLINKEESMNPKPGVKPANTYELILKLKNLYAAISKKLDTDADNIKYETILTDIEKIDLSIELLKDNAYKENDTLTSAGKPYLVALKPQERDNYVTINEDVPDTMIPIENLEEFNEIIKTEQSSGYKSTIRNKLYMIYLVGTNFVEQNNSAPLSLKPVPSNFVSPSLNDSNFTEPLLKFKEQLLNNAKTISSLDITDNDISAPEAFKNPYNIQTLTSNITNLTKYYGMDMSVFYHKLYKKKSELEEERNALSLNIATRINAMVSERLGMIPSIYNIFEIILKDVDTFFTILKSTSNDAFESHNNVPANKKIILGDGSYKDNNIDVYSFPLVINTLNNREERVAPIDLSKKVKFPELDLVSNFMDTFLIQNRYAKLINSREDQNDSGEYKWIPIAPIDSTLGGATPESPYIGLSDDVITETLKIMLERFYIFSQGTLPDAIYVESTDEKRADKENVIVGDAYVKLYAKAEAINLASALVSENTRKALEVMSKEYTNTKLGKFYRDISGLTFTYNDGSINKTDFLSRFPKNDPKYFSITPTTEGRVYVNKDNKDFTGLHMINNNVVQVQDSNNQSSNPIDKFADSIKDQTKGLFRTPASESHIEFTLDNLMYFRDTITDSLTNKIRGKVNKVNNIDGISMNTRYLNPGEYNSYALGATSYFPGSVYQTDAERQEIALAEGNTGFTYQSLPDKEYLDVNNDIIDLWANVLGKHDTALIGTLLNSPKLSSMLILSNFGYTASPFNVYANSLNNIVFSTPAVIEIPQFYAPYLGMLVHAIENNWVDEIKDFFITGAGKDLDNRGFYVLADLHDVENHLSNNDKAKLLNEYTTYMSSFQGRIVSGLEDLFELVRANENLDIRNPEFLGSKLTLKEKREELYEYYLNKNGKIKINGDDNSDENPFTGNEGIYFERIIKNLITRTNMVNYNQITFRIFSPDEIGYTSLEEQNQSTVKVNGKSLKTINDSYFTTFFGELNSIIGEKELSLKEEEDELKKVKGDVDIINQLYYSFKNINDKWITGTASGDLKYPFNSGRGGLIDSFAFVDRGMNPIGETILNCEVLSDMLEDPNISLFSVLTQLLSLNGFEFFPLQNFMSFETDTSWEDSFKVHTGGYEDNQNPFFVCMYIGGTASYPSVSGNGFVEDGILDIAAPDVKGFSGDDSGNEYEENEKQGKDNNFPWRQVRAFRVRFGEQNQSMFTDIKIDSKEYPETNESIQILSRLAGDQNPDAPVPKGQNLYNLYENRSYKATVTGFGNAMIQPTQYFQLENIPLFNGAYIILTVEHNISANKMTTSFSGTKLLKYPMPRVLTPVAFTSYDGLSGGEAVRAALNVAPQATLISKETLERQKSVLGVDISHHNGVADWKKAKAAGVEVGFIKLTQGTTFYSGTRYDIDKQVNGAKSNDIPLSYYHFAELGKTSSPIIDAQNQANWFISKLNLFDKSKLPVVLDVEGGEGWVSDYKWSNKSEDINIFIETFLNTINDAGYKTMLYCGASFIEKYGIRNPNNTELWIPRYFNPNNKNQNAEISDPPLPDDWVDWDIWQFTSQGIVDGVPPAGQSNATGVDLNMVRKNFLKSHKV